MSLRGGDVGRETHARGSCAAEDGAPGPGSARSQRKDGSAAQAARRHLRPSSPAPGAIAARRSSPRRAASSRRRRRAPSLSERIPIDGSPSRSALTTSAGVTPFAAAVPRDAHVRDVVGDLGHEDLGLDAGHGRRAAPDHLGALVELAPLARVVLLQEQLQRRPACRASLPCSPSCRGRSCCRWEARSAGPPRSGPCGRAAGRRSAARGCPCRRRTSRGRSPSWCTSTGSRPAARRRRVVEGRDAVLLSELDELLVLDLPFRVVVVVEEHHGGLRR